MTGSSVAVIGAGPAGLQAATSAAGFGLDVLLFDQFGLASDVPAAVRVFDQTPVWGLFPGWTIAATRDDEPMVEQVEAVILCTGAIDKVVPFAGGSQPGVITAGGLYRLMQVHRLLPGQRFVVVGDGEDAASAIECIESAGGDVVLRVADPDARLMVAYGSAGIERVVSGDTAVEADIVVMAIGRTPDIILAAIAECDLRFDMASDAWAVQRDSALESSQSGIWAAGDVAGCIDAATSRAEGRFAAAQVATRLGALDDDGLEREHRLLEQAVTPKGQTPVEIAKTETWASAMVERGSPEFPPCFVCRCEEVSAERLADQISMGATTLNDLKRRARAGMGLCQGAYCLAEMARMLAEQTGTSVTEIAPMTYRPPARPVTLDALARSSD
ncbi:NAD(P)/FAD-dependent oxidoreductase [soil metagenome]